MNLTELEEQILDLLKNKKTNMTFKQIKRTLRINNQEQINILIDSLKNLEANGYLYLNDYDEYILFSKMHDLAIGELRCNCKNKPYVVVGRHNVFIHSNHLNGAIAGDIVIVKRHNFRAEGNTRGIIDKILKRTNGEIIFDYVNGELIPYNWPFPIKVALPKEQLDELVDGSRILVKLSLNMINDDFEGKIVSLVGHKDDPQLDVKTIASKNGIVIDFSKEALEQARKINLFVTEEEIKERLEHDGLDLRNENIFTIDGFQTKDIDDAVSIKKLPNGIYRLGVHIADVSHYIPENSPLDLEARDRSTSAYPYNCVIPMLPHHLSNGICSLNPHVDRLALSCIMDINQHGEIVDFQIVDTIINSKMKMAYEEINDIFERHINHPDYEPYLYDLALLGELSTILEKRKQERGYLFFGDNDVLFDDDHGIAIGVNREKRGMAQKMIENAMLSANECIASFYYWLEMPGIYRNHPAPDITNIKQILDYLQLKIKIPNNINNPHIIQRLLTRIQQYDEGNVYGDILLQAMKRAYYSPHDTGHFGLSLPYYTHFTSPIRRYPDLQTHRIVRQIRDNILDINFETLTNTLTDICRHSSYKEKIADKVERDVNYYKMAEYMSQHIGEHFIGYVCGISKNGVSVKLDNLIVGKIDMDTLHDKGFSFDNKHLRLINRSKQIISIGDCLDIKLISADKNSGHIEFVLKEIKQKIKQMENVG